MTLSQQQRALARADCEIAFDNLTRQLYATDASIYQVEPLAVAFPRTSAQAVSALRTAAEANVSLAGQHGEDRHRQLAWRRAD